MMRRLTVSVAFLFALMLLAPGVAAQDATPMANPVSASSLLASLGYPELVITSDGNSTDIPLKLPRDAITWC